MYPTRTLTRHAQNKLYCNLNKFYNFLNLFLLVGLHLQVAWVRVDTQTILTIHTHVITRSHRIGLSHTDSWTWNLHIRNVKEADRGFYMAQINTGMRSEGYVLFTSFTLDWLWFLADLFFKI